MWKKQANPQQVAEVFVNSLIYGRDQQDFIRYFKDGEAIEQTIETNEKEFQKNASFMLSSLVGDSVTSKKQTKKLSKNILSAMKTQTSYKVKDIEEQDKGQRIKITYEVFGLDFQQAITQTMEAVLDQALQNHELLGDEEHLGEVTLNSFILSVKEITAKQQPTEVTLTLRKRGTQWYVKKSDETQLLKLSYTFMVGVKTEEALQTQIQEGIQKGITEAKKAQEKREEQLTESASANSDGSD